MPEYKRFIAYFYEYIDGKKQKNVGFAKVELRNRMWRILFRLTTGICPEPPVQVYGFVREGGYLLAFPMGTMPGGGEIAQEWAYRAESPIGFDKYCLEDLSGIWIRSGEPRCFITVWDDDPVNTAQFIMELPERMTEAIKPENTEPENTEPENIEPENTEPEKIEPESIESYKTKPEEIIETDAKSYIARAETHEESVDGMQKETAPVEAAELYISTGGGIEEDCRTMESGADSVCMDESGRAEDLRDPGCIGELLEKRQHFHPFNDNEFETCVQILPCDIVRMQQENWHVGRSSFLQHGYYQYRHLLLGKLRDGTYVLGVPGIQNQQEQYMAKMFGYDRFKTSRIYVCGRIFGYWYRML